MKTPLVGLWLSALVSLAAGPAKAAGQGEGVLLVTVEATPEAGISATDIRRAVATELGRPVVAPGEPGAGEAHQILIISLDETRIRISLREGLFGVVSREIPAPSSGRLQAIAWLVGNIARDQVSGLETGPTSPTEPRPFAAPPRSVANAVEAGGAPAAAISERSEVPEGRDHEGTFWTATVAGGPMWTTYGFPGTANSRFLSSRLVQAEVQRQSNRDLVGGTMMVSATTDTPHVFCVSAFIGSRRQFRFLAFEGTVGAGIEAVRAHTWNVSSSMGSDGSSSYTRTMTIETVPALVLRGTTNAVVTLTTKVDAVLGLNLHVTNQGLTTDFGAIVAGLRMRLP